MHEPLPVTSEDVSSYLAPSCSVDDFAIDTLLVEFVTSNILLNVFRVVLFNS